MKLAFSILAGPSWSYEQLIEAARPLSYDGVEWRLTSAELSHASTDSKLRGDPAEHFLGVHGSWLPPA